MTRSTGAFVALAASLLAACPTASAGPINGTGFNITASGVSVRIGDDWGTEVDLDSLSVDTAEQIGTPPASAVLTSLTNMEESALRTPGVRP